MRRCCVLVATVSLIAGLIGSASPVLAQTAPCPNGIGIYFDQGGISNCSTAAPYSSVTAYLVITHPTTQGVSGWECKLVTEPAALPAGLTVALLGGGLNVLAHPYYQVGIGAIGGIGVGATAIPVASLTTFYLGGPVRFGIAPCVPSSFGGLAPGFAAGDNPGLVVPATPVASSPINGEPNGYWVAGINANNCPFIDCGSSPEVVPITDIQVYTPSGAPASPLSGSQVLVNGRVTCPVNGFGDGFTYVQDTTGGIAITSTAGLAFGDSVSVRGDVQSQDGEVVLTNAYAANRGYLGPPNPALLTITQALDFEQVGRLVNVYGRVGAPASDGFRLEIGTTYLPVKVAATIGISLAGVGLGDQYSVTGILRVRSGQIQLWPRSQPDLVEISAPYLFTLGVDVNCGGLQDMGNVLGTALSATDGFDPTLEPPEPPHPPTNYLAAYFAHPEWGLPLGEAFTKDLRLEYDLNVERKSWPFSVLTDRVGTVVLSFSPSFAANTGFDIVVEDLATGGLTFLFPELTYAYESTGAGRRDFLIHVGRYYQVPAVEPATRACAPGWSMLGLPLVPVAGQETVGQILLDDLTGTGWVFSYLGASGYGMVGADYNWPRGQGLWLAGLTPFEWDMQGVRDVGTTDIPLAEGWSLLGYPLWFTLPLDNVRVLHGGSVYTYTEAVAANLVSGNVYGWDTAGGDYLTAVDLRAWNGYWVAAYASGVSLRFNYRYLYDAKARALAKADLPPADAVGDDWRAELRLADRSGRTARLVLGVSPAATDGFDAACDLPVPPVSPRGAAPEIAALHPEWNLATGVAFATDVRTDKNPSQVWRARLTLPQAGTATLSWDASRWPKDVDLNLYVPDQNRVIARSMRAQGSAQLDVPAGGLIVEFRTPDHVTGVPPSDLSAVGLHCVPNPFNPSTEMRFALPAGGNAEVRLFDARGREVRRLVAGERPAGPQSLRWDGRDSAGADAASGTYFARVYLDGAPVGHAVKASLVK